MKYKLIIAICAILAVLLACKFLVNDKKVEVRTDIEPIEKRFHKIENIEECYWYANVFDNSFFSLGPTNYNLVALIKVSKSEKDKIVEKYTFEKKEVSIDEILLDNYMDVTNENFWYNSDLEKEILDGAFIGNVFFDKTNGIFFLSVENL